jgi:hypothetical protein
MKQVSIHLSLPDEISTPLRAALWGVKTTKGFNVSDIRSTGNAFCVRVTAARSSKTGGEGARGRRFMWVSWELFVERQAKLSNKHLGEGRGGRFHPDGLVTYTFSRLRCKPTASQLAAGLFSGAAVATRRVHYGQQTT